MDIKQLLVMIRRWLWLIILGTVIGAVGGYYYSARETPIYQSTTRFVVLRAAQTTTDYFAYLDSQQLVTTYAELLTTENLLNQVSEELGFQVYKGQASATQIENTQFVQLSVRHPDPTKAAAIANALIKVLIEQNEVYQSVRYITAEQNLQNRIDEAQEQIGLLQGQITAISTETVAQQKAIVEAQLSDLQTQVTDLELEISKIDPEFATEAEKIQLAELQSNLNIVAPILSLYQQIYTNLVVLGKPAEEGTITSTQLDQLQTTLNLYQQIYVSSISSLEALRLSRAQSTPNVIQVEVARVPTSPISPKPRQSTILAGVVGLLITAGIAFLVEYLDDTIKTPDEVKAVLDLPVIGLIGEFRQSDKEKSGVFVARHPRSPVSEAFRALRTNLEFSSVDSPLNSLLVTSSGATEGKTTVATNLAIVLVQGGKKVLLIDADLRRPNIHSQFGLNNRIGLSDLIRGKLKPEEVIKTLGESKTLDIITSGSLPPNPAELLGSEKMAQLLEEFTNRYDVVILDSPPTLVSDAQILSTKVDGLIYVLIPGNTHAVAATRPLEELRRINARLLGVVMNRIPRNRDYYYGGYNYYSPYSDHDGYHHSGSLDEASDSFTPGSIPSSSGKRR